MFPFRISDSLVITPLNQQTFIHTCDNSNGLVFTSQDDAIIISTPPSDRITYELINWVKDSLRKEIVAYVIDRWHPDAMEGLNVVQSLGIPSYANEMTCEIAAEKNLPVSKHCFNTKLVINVGRDKVICHYLGPAHTKDGIIVYIPSQKILFGGNEIRNFNGWVGNIADAYVDEWSNTVKKVKQEYGDALIVIPGHGNHGGPELIDYTIELYTPSKWGAILKHHNIMPRDIFDDRGKFFAIAEKASGTDQGRILFDAILFIDKGDQYIMLNTSSVTINPYEKGFISETGRIRILNKQKGSNLKEVDGYYKQLFINLTDNEVKMTVVMRELIR
jgi:glyoxylase-like metal-dependent hydrolase (beta-lactamase superfamily II)